MDEVHHTEADGLEATWRPTHNASREIEIMKVHNISGDDAEPDVTFAPGTDLVAARESRPRWDRLWNAVRAEFWAGISPALRPSATGNAGMRWRD